MTLRFAHFEIDPDRRQLRYEGREIALQPLLFDLLVYFARHPDTVIARDVLLRDVWKRVAVSDGAIAQAVSQLRHVLQIEPSAPAIIRTIWGHGYRFVAGVFSNGGETPDVAIASAGSAAHAAAIGSARGGDGQWGPSLATARQVFPMVGRVRERTLLDAGLRAAIGGRGSVVLISGEPGIGKTRLVEEFANDAENSGVRVLWGACLEGGGAPPFWPWTQVFRAYANGVTTSDLRETVGATAEHLTLIAPEIAGHSGSELPADFLGGSRSRFELLDAAKTFVTRAAARQPLVLVFDDLHAADAASLELLGLLAQGIRNAPLLIVATHRDAEVRRQPAVARAVGDIGRQGTHLPLCGLDQSAIAHFFSAGMAYEPTTEVIERLQSATDGNPFLLEEMLLTLGEAPAQHWVGSSSYRPPLPARAAQLIGRRLDLLSPEARNAVRVAALLGTEFSAVELGTLLRRRSDLIRAQLREAADDGILIDESITETRYRFRHALLRDALERELPTEERIALHAAIGEMIEQSHASSLGPWLDRIAYHFLQGATETTWRRAVDYAVLVAERAMARVAYEDADGYLSAALDLLRIEDDGDEARRCEILLMLGTCRLRAVGLEAARPLFARAADAARALGRPDFLAFAALGYTPFTAYGLTSESGLELLEEAVAAQPAADSALKAALLARLAHTLDGSAGARSSRKRIAGLSRRAVRMARRTGDLPALGRALFAARWVEWDPARLRARRATTDEMQRVAARLSDRGLAVLAEGWRLADALERSEPQAVDEAMRRHAGLARVLREPEHTWWSAVWRAMRAVADGRYLEAEELIVVACEIGQGVEAENALLVAYVQRSRVLTEQQRFTDALSDLEQLVAARPEIFEGDVSMLCRKARLYAALGRTLEAHQAMERVAADGFSALVPSMPYVDNLASLAVTCATLRNRTWAAEIYERLRAATGQNLVFGPALVVVGPAAHYQGLLAAVMDRDDVARRHFEDALATSRRMGWRSMLVRTQYEYASLLLRRGGREPRSLARTLLDEAERGAATLGLERTVGEIRARRAGAAS